MLAYIYFERWLFNQALSCCMPVMTFYSIHTWKDLQNKNKDEWRAINVFVWN